MNNEWWMINDLWWLVNDDEHDNNDEVTWTFIIMMSKNMTTVDLTRCFHPSHKIKAWKACITQYGSLWNPSQSVQPKSKSKVSRPQPELPNSRPLPYLWLPASATWVQVGDCGGCGSIDLLHSNLHVTVQHLSILGFPYNCFSNPWIFCNSSAFSFNAKVCLAAFSPGEAVGRSLRQMLIQGGTEIPNESVFHVGPQGLGLKERSLKHDQSWQSSLLIVACGPRRIWLLPTPWVQMPGWRNTRPDSFSDPTKQDQIYLSPKFDPCFWLCLGILLKE